MSPKEPLRPYCVPGLGKPKGQLGITALDARWVAEWELQEPVPDIEVTQPQDGLINLGLGVGFTGRGLI